jgi:hypothetical protein
LQVWCGSTGPWGERFIADDEDGFIGLGILIPGKIGDGALYGGTTVFLAATGGKGFDLFADFIELTGERLNLADVMITHGQVVVSVL